LSEVHVIERVEKLRAKLGPHWLDDGEILQKAQIRIEKAVPRRMFLPEFPKVPMAFGTKSLDQAGSYRRAKQRLFWRRERRD